MDDLISRQAAIDVINRAVTKEAARWSVEELPPAERKKGRWIDCNWSVRCSECDYAIPMAVWNFCPNCGAEMRGEEDG